MKRPRTAPGADPIAQAVNWNLTLTQGVRELIQVPTIAVGANHMARVEVGKLAAIMKLAAQADVRVRLYGSEVGQIADLARAWGTAWPPDRAIYGDFQMTLAGLALDVYPARLVANVEDPRNPFVYVTLTNIDVAPVDLYLEIFFSTLDP